MSKKEDTLNPEAKKEAMIKKALAQRLAQRIMKLPPEERARIREQSKETLRKLSEQSKKK
ncbi:hypothetical protein [Lentimicrobium sp. S6]|uniref:hypothetical protein n=1 Tax=Lentimicrobium sp. S6 TaxID=2735872 RepID=UPI001556A2DC|nr:hypothetical protein [Lentimicrobium sp. S6]NPD47605.1 hypothetical protein [Lentimicrobium sp. S6]